MFILIVTSHPAKFTDFLTELTKKGVDIGLTSTARAALVHAKIEPPTLAVVDEILADDTPFAFVAKLMQANAAILTAVVSQLTPSAFLAASEGLDILTALPPHPNAEDARSLLKALAA